jgi:hypothetical protein
VSLAQLRQSRRPARRPLQVPRPQRRHHRPPLRRPLRYKSSMPGLVANCDKFYRVTSVDTCEVIEAKYGISPAQFSSWNPSINASELFSPAPNWRYQPDTSTRLQ